MSTINVTDAGPIEGTFTIDLSPGPGVYEFRGARGTGKTTCISSIDWLAGHKVDVTLHDGALSGKVQGFGVVAPIGGRRRRRGDFGLDTIDAEKFSLTDLIDPPGKTPEVRDAHAIKALASLSETKADPALYYELSGGQATFDALGVAKTDDPVLLATRVKQSFDKQAREKENTADAEAAHAAPLEIVPDGVDMSQSSDLETLGNERDDARDESQRLKIARETGLAAEQETAHAKDRLETVQTEYDGQGVEDATDEHNAAIKWAEGARNIVADLETKLIEARNTLSSAVNAEGIATARVLAAQQHAEAVSSLEAVASRENTYPDEAHIAKIGAAVEANTLAYDQGIRIRDAKQNQAKAKSHREAAEVAEKQSAAAKNKASQVFDLLAQSLHTSHLEIQPVDGAPRLFVQHPKRGRCAFDRVNGLSDGERVDFTLRELLPYIESPGLLPIPQRVWQDLQPTDRQNLHKLAVEKNLFLFGAQVDDGNLRVAYLGEDTE